MQLGHLGPRAERSKPTEVPGPSVVGDVGVAKRQGGQSWRRRQRRRRWRRWRERRRNRHGHAHVLDAARFTICSIVQRRVQREAAKSGAGRGSGGEGSGGEGERRRGQTRRRKRWRQVRERSWRWRGVRRAIAKAASVRERLRGRRQTRAWGGGSSDERGAAHVVAEGACEVRIGMGMRRPHRPPSPARGLDYVSRVLPRGVGLSGLYH